MIVTASREHWESLTDARRPKRVRTRRDIRRGRQHDTARLGR